MQKTILPPTDYEELEKQEAEYRQKYYTQLRTERNELRKELKDASISILDKYKLLQQANQHRACISTTDMILTSVKLPHEILNILDTIVVAKLAASRSELIRTAITLYILMMYGDIAQQILQESLKCKKK